MHCEFFVIRCDIKFQTCEKTIVLHLCKITQVIGNMSIYFTCSQHLLALGRVSVFIFYVKFVNYSTNDLES